MQERFRLRQLAPAGEVVTDYDRHHLSLYAALLDADDGGECWREAALALMKLDPDAGGSEACWRSHLVRGRWIVERGLAAALGAFGSPETGSGDTLV